LTPPDSGKWYDTEPEVTDASDAILAAARGASPANPVWVVPVGPGTNVASAILQVRTEGLDLKNHLRVIWLGGSNDAEVENVTVAGPDQQYTWTRSDDPHAVRVIRETDQ
jgi:inosine-uridine nucleoside N-ribohydrolase